MMFRALLGFCIKKVKPQRVFVQLCFIEKAGTEQNPLGFSNLAFKDGFLHAHAIIRTGSRHTPQAFRPAFVRRGNIISNKNKHGAIYLGMKGAYAARSPLNTRAKIRA